MRLIAISASLCFALLGPVAVAATESYSLDQCYELALARSDVIAGQTELITQAEEHIVQARGSFLPNLGFSATFATQEAPSSVIGQSLFPSNQTTVKLTASQSIFKGFRDFATLKQRKSEMRSSEAAREQAKIQLFQDTAQAFYNVVTYEHDLLNYRNEIAADEDRKKELVGLKRLARARESDIMSIDSSIAAIEASIANTRGLIGAAREALAFLTGLSPEITLSDQDLLPDTLLPLGSWVDRVERRPDVIQGKESVEAAYDSVKAARGNHYPSVDLVGNYYLDRPGVYSGVNWDVQLGLSLPLFSGGATQSQVREAASVRTGREVALDQIRKQADRDIRSAYRSVDADLEQAGKLAKATEFSRRNYELLLKDNRSGNATNIDVLQALANAHQIRRSWDHSRYVAKYDYVRLQVFAASRGTNQ